MKPGKIKGAKPQRGERGIAGLLPTSWSTLGALRSVLEVGAALQQSRWVLVGGEPRAGRMSPQCGESLSRAPATAPSLLPWQQALSRGQLPKTSPSVAFQGPLHFPGMNGDSRVCQWLQNLLLLWTNHSNFKEEGNETGLQIYSLSRWGGQTLLDCTMGMKEKESSTMPGLLLLPQKARKGQKIIRCGVVWCGT